ncbi:hypothetical protein ElyMa_002892100 [Elysia marginata]|uniref:Reverse transcriptase domain-containing protein n=1 Tax=Elysia marginata TaxID=1093978 RepID=A0AAV4I4S7_9GAST|nr:hypothetical protein ElyMa_002892100 [Elysia marginata]
MRGTVQYDESTSASFPILSGFKQGCLLAATLFGILFSLDLDNVFKNTTKGIYIFMQNLMGKLFKIQHLKTKTKLRHVLNRKLLFADAAASEAHTGAGLQNTVHLMAEDCNEFELTITIKLNGLKSCAKMLVKFKKRANVFHMRCLRLVLGITWKGLIPNSEVLKPSNLLRNEAHSRNIRFTQTDPTSLLPHLPNRITSSVWTDISDAVTCAQLTVTRFPSSRGFLHNSVSGLCSPLLWLESSSAPGAHPVQTAEGSLYLDPGVCNDGFQIGLIADDDDNVYMLVHVLGEEKVEVREGLACSINVEEDRQWAG